MAETPKDQADATPSKRDARNIVAVADLTTKASYDFTSETAGLGGFWTGEVTAYFGGTTLKGSAKARGPDRAICLALLDLANAGLKVFPSGLGNARS